MSEMREYLERERAGWITLGRHFPLLDFLIEHGKDYAVGPETYAGPRGEPKACFMNATHLALNQGLTYVEGKVATLGMFIDHAWCVNEGGIVIDPTLAPDKDDKLDRIGGYFGVPFITAYVQKACLKNGVYGLLDGYGSRKTLPKLIELGLEEGQKWLIGKRRRKA